MEIPVQLKAPDLLKALEQLTSAEIDEVLLQARSIQKRHQSEDVLLGVINRQLAPEKKRRLHELSAKQEAEIITDAEREELISLTDEIEASDVERAEALVNLAQIRQVSMRQLLKQLNLERDLD